MIRIHGFIGLIFTLLGFLSKAVYRDYINSYEIHDLGFSDFLPSFFYVVGFSQLLLIQPTRRPYLIVSVVALASVLYEFMQYNSSGKLDILDIFASMAGGISSILITKKIRLPIN